MRISEHLSKVEAFERAAAKLDPTEDNALYVVFLLRAATNRVNGALHALGTTTDGAATSGKIGDLNHTYKPKLNVPVPEELRASFRYLDLIEHLRPDYVRGQKPVDATIVGACKAAYAAICRDTDSILAGELR